MKHNGVMAASVIAALGLGARALGAPAPAPAPHSFIPPPTLPGESQTLRPQALALAPAPTPGGCVPAGVMTRNGAIVAVRLDFVRGHFTINNPDPTDPQAMHEDPVELRSYGGCQSGPTIEVQPGDTLRVDLTNGTSKDDPSCLPNPPPGLGVPKFVGCYNTTNLHTHGLHVSPAGNSDNVLLNIAPKTEFPYEINIPEDHPSGTFWYHAHRHGSTAVQVASGASGVLIVRGERPYRAPTKADPHPIADIDTVLHTPDGAAFPEQVFLLQQIAYGCFQNDPSNPGANWQQLLVNQGAGKPPGILTVNTDQNSPLWNDPWLCPAATAKQPVSPGAVENFQLQLFSPTVWDTNGRFTSINGVVQPRLTVPAGQIQRWRFVHAGIHDTINLQVVRATPTGAGRLIALAALSGNREQQKRQVEAACVATPATLVPQFEIASDGLTRARLHTIHAGTIGDVLESNYLQPGYRSDILVVFPSAGDYCLLDQAAPPSERVSNGGGGGQGPSTPQLLAYVHVTPGQALSVDPQTYVAQTLYDANPQLPQPVRDGLKAGDLSPWAPFIEEPPATSLQKAEFAIPFPAFTINGASYNPDVINYTRQVNTTDDWLLTADGEPHIFHIHVNPFEVMDVTTADPAGKQVSIYDANGQCKPELVAGDKHQLSNQYCGMFHTFRDTVFVENNYEIHVRTTYDRYIGEFVIHCHILDHEDAGMMANIEIVPDLGAPGHGLGMPQMRHDMAAMEMGK